MIDFSTILREDNHAYVITIPLEAVVDFLTRGTPSVVMVDAETRAALQARGLGPKF
jgi:hypothetical protein